MQNHIAIVQIVQYNIGIESFFVKFHNKMAALMEGDKGTSEQGKYSTN